MVICRCCILLSTQMHLEYLHYLGARRAIQYCKLCSVDLHDSPCLQPEGRTESTNFLGIPWLLLKRFDMYLIPSILARWFCTYFGRCTRLLKPFRRSWRTGKPFIIPRLMAGDHLSVNKLRLMFTANSLPLISHIAGYFCPTGMC